MDIFKKRLNKRQTVWLEVGSSVWDFYFILGKNQMMLDDFISCIIFSPSLGRKS